MSCRENFQEMLISCDLAEKNIDQMHDSMKALGIDVIEKITSEIERLGQEVEQSVNSPEFREESDALRSIIREYLRDGVDREKKRFMEVKIVKEHIIDVLKGYREGKVGIESILSQVGAVIMIGL